MHLKKRQNIFIILLSVALIAAIVINFVIIWYNNNAIVSKIEFLGEVPLHYTILNSQTLYVNSAEVTAGNVITRSIRFGSEASYEDYYLRIRIEFRIDGTRTNEVSLNVESTTIMDNVDRNFLKGTETSKNWFYCDRAIDSIDYVSPNLEFVIKDDLSASRTNKNLTVTIYVETVTVSTGYEDWNYLPDNFPYVEEVE